MENSNAKSSKKKFTFSKAERLKKRSVIDELFKKSRAVTVYPVRALFLLLPSETEENLIFPVKAGVSAAKKRFPKAVQRTHLKRLLRESYRLQKHQLAQAVPKNQYLAVMFLYIGKEDKPDFQFVYKKMEKCLNRIEELVK